MAEETKVVETTTETATTPQEVDYEALLAEKDAAIAKVQQEKENYRKGMLKAKGKLPEEDHLDNDKPEEDERFRRIAREEMLSTKEAQLQADKDATISALAKRTKELETALRNRGQITSASALGSNQDKPEVKTDSYFSSEQIAHFKKQGKSDEWIETAKKNMLKGTQAPR